MDAPFAALVGVVSTIAVAVAVAAGADLKEILLYAPDCAVAGEGGA